MKKRADSFFGMHFDFHASPSPTTPPVGTSLKEEDLRELCTLLKPDFVQCDCKGHPGWVSYPTTLGNAMPAFEKDPLALWRRVTEAEDVALYVHYSGIWDKLYCTRHPEHTAMRPDGSLSENAVRVDSPYADEVLIPQLRETADRYGVNGCWIDGDCWGLEPDFRPESIAAFEKAMGVNLKGRLPAKPEDPFYDEYREYTRNLYRNYLRHITRELHRTNPDYQVCSNWSFSAMMPEAVTADMDFLSGDFDPKNSCAASRIHARAIAMQRKPWDLMAWSFRAWWSQRNGHQTKHAVQLMQEAASVISLGGGFQIYVTQRRDGGLKMDEVRRMAPVAAFVRARRDYCFRGETVPQVGVLLSQYDRNLESAAVYSWNGSEGITGAVCLTADAGHSVSLFSEYAPLKGEKVAIVPALSRGLASETSERLLDYVRGGGCLVLLGETACRCFADAGVPFTLGPKTDTRMFTCNGTEFTTLNDSCTVNADGEPLAWFAADSLSPLEPAAVKIPFGKGFVVPVGFDLGRDYYTIAQYLHLDFIRKVLASLYTPLVRIEAARGTLELNDLTVNGSLCIQLTNFNGNHRSGNVATEADIPPVTGIRLSVASEKPPRMVLLQPEGRALDFDWADGRFTVAIPEVEIHSVVQVLA